jgi:hypothetical protein
MVIMVNEVVQWWERCDEGRGQKRESDSGSGWVWTKRKQLSGGDGSKCRSATLCGGGGTGWCGDSYIAQHPKRRNPIAIDATLLKAVQKLGHLARHT